MARNTSINLRNKVIYEMFIRAHTEEGTFRAAMKDLKRIKELGTDILWIMPICPIGEKERKGSLGSPYAIKDYIGINEELGDLNDFKVFIKAVHDLGMEIMLDIVYNHTSPDSDLFKNHPEYFYITKKGTFGNRLGEWHDVLDLDYGNKNLWEEQIKGLKYWSELGVDGYRCDVGPMVPIEFWERARKEIEKINPNTLWLCESGGPGVVELIRNMDIDYASDAECYQAFDMTYDYDAYPFFRNFIEGKGSLEEYHERLRIQEGCYPRNYIKMRYLENHDKPRVANLLQVKEQLIQWTAECYFLKGPMLLYAGQETLDSHRPSLFDKDTINWTGQDVQYTNLLKKLGRLKKDKIMASGIYRINKLDVTDVSYMTYEQEDRVLAGIFNIGLKTGSILTGLPDGQYKNILDDQNVIVKNSMMKLQVMPIIIEVNGKLEVDKPKPVMEED